MSQSPQHREAPEPPAMGERRARWGYGYQDKVATDRILRILKDELRGGSAAFEGVRLADLQAGRVDDFVLVWNRQVEGNSIKWSGEASPMNWGDLVGAKGLIKELAQGFLRSARDGPTVPSPFVFKPIVRRLWRRVLTRLSRPSAWPSSSGTTGRWDRRLRIPKS